MYSQLVVPAIGSNSTCNRICPVALVIPPVPLVKVINEANPPLSGRQIDRSGVRPKEFISIFWSDDAVAGEKRDRRHFGLAVCNDLVHGEAIFALKASPYVPRRAERTWTTVGWLNVGLETSYNWFAFLRRNWDHHRCYEEKPHPSRDNFAGSFYNLVLLFGAKWL
jgi:hypothetical protein